MQRSPSVRALTGLLLSLGIGAPGRSASAAPARGASEAESRPLAVISIVGTQAESDEVLSLLAGPPFAELEWRARTVPRLDTAALLEGIEPESRLRCFVDPKGARGANVYASDGRAERFVVRSVPLGPDATLDRDALRTALAEAVHEVQTGWSSAFGRDEMRAWLASSDAPLAEPAKPGPKPALPFPVRTAGFYDVAMHSGRVPLVHGPGVSVGVVDFGSPRHGTLFLGVVYGLPRHTLAPYELVLTSIALRVGSEATAKVSSSPVRAGGRLSLGVDLERVTAASGGSYGLVSGPMKESFVVSLAALASFRLGPDAVLFAELGASIDPLPVRYEVESARAKVRTDERYRVRPSLSAGIRMW